MVFVKLLTYSEAVKHKNRKLLAKSNTIGVSINKCMGNLMVTEGTSSGHSKTSEPLKNAQVYEHLYEASQSLSIHLKYGVSNVGYIK